MEDDGARRVSESADFISDIVGDEALAGKRMQTGQILDIIDVCAARVAYKHARCNCVTASVDVVVLLHPLLHMDLVKMEGRMVHVGSSSMTIQVKAYRQDVPSREWQHVETCFLTMVGVNKDGTPNKNIPPLIFDLGDREQVEGEVRRRKELSSQWNAMQERAIPIESLRADTVEDDSNKNKQEYLAIEQTKVVVKRNFFPKHTNINNTVFGGEIMMWMDKVAVQCARLFVRGQNVVTICMNRVFFKKPMYVTDWVEMVARVVYVRLHTLEVEVEVWLERLDGTKVHAHTGFFIILYFNEVGYKQQILTGLKLTDNDTTSLLRYYKAKQRFSFWKQYDSRGLVV